MTTITQRDTDIRDEVQAELTLNPAVTATDIGVRVNDGVVGLFGFVETYPMREAAAETAHRVRGVRAVANELEVKLASDARYSDAEIAQVAAQMLAWSIEVPKGRVDVTVSEGRVELTGTVDWHYQREAAEETVRRARGVRGVLNRITVASNLKPVNIKQTIESALVRGAQTDAHHIRVEVHDRTVTLKGAVRTWAEKEDAKRAAWSTPGVTAIVDDLAIIPDLGR